MNTLTWEWSYNNFRFSSFQRKRFFYARILCWWKYGRYFIIDTVSTNDISVISFLVATWPLLVRPSVCMNLCKYVCSLWKLERNARLSSEHFANTYFCVFIHTCPANNKHTHALRFQSKGRGYKPSESFRLGYYPLRPPPPLFTPKKSIFNDFPYTHKRYCLSETTSSQKRIWFLFRSSGKTTQLQWEFFYKKRKKKRKKKIRRLRELKEKTRLWRTK